MDMDSMKKMMDPLAVLQFREIIPAKQTKKLSLLHNIKATISFHCDFCRGGVDDRLLQNVQLEINDHPNLTCDVDDNHVLIEGCLRTDVEQQRNITGDIVCMHWKDACSFLAKIKNMRSCSTVMVQVDTPKNHFITIHCNFSEDRVILLDSFQCTNGLEIYSELALELEHLMKDQSISLIPVAIQKEINDGFYHSFINSLTVEWSKLLTTQQTYEIFLNELEIFQGLLKSSITREKSLIDHDMNRIGSLKEIVKERIQSGVAKGETLEDIKDSMKTVCQSLTRDIDVYIELKYAKCVADTFLKHLQNILETEGSSFVILRSEVQNISEIKDMKEPFNTILNYEQLQECATLLNSKTKLRFMKSFHDLCHYNSTSEKEIEIEERNFLNELQNHMKNIVFDMHQTSEKLPKYLKNAWKKPNNALDANDLLKKLSKTNDRSLSKLQSLSLKLSNCHSESFVISLGSLCVRFYEKMSISFVTENGVDIIRCKGTFVDLRTVNKKIEAEQDLFETFSQIEIHAELYFCVNCDVKWRGKNVIIVTDTLIVDEDIEHYSLDVSGKNGPSHSYKKARNGTESDRNGFPGEPGMHGESGGNVQIIANVFKDVDNMTIISNGGDGSDGQHGGTGADGIHGVDGKEISEEVFNKRFPDVAHANTATFANNFQTFKKNNSFSTVFEEIATGLFNTNEYGIGGKYYLKGVTDDNHVIEYGVWSNGALLSLPALVGAPFRQSYCFCSGQPGTPGTPGGNGGKGGAAGKGGFQGNIDIRNWKGNHMCTIKTSCHPGQCGSDGKDGKGGIGGKNGKKGNDRAHICPSQARSTRVYAGHLSIVVSETSTTDMSYCSKREKYIAIRRNASEYPALQRCKDGEKGQSNKRRNNRMTETSRTKKAPIVFKKIQERFQHMFYSKDDSISFKDNFEANTTRMEDFTSYATTQHIRKMIKDTREHDYKNEIQSKQLAPLCIAKKNSHFNDTQKAKFERNHHLEKLLMQKVETAVSEVLTSVNIETKEAFPDKELCTIFAILDQMSIPNSFDEKHYEYFLDSIFLIKNKCMKPFCEENWTNLNVNYWEDRIMTNFKFYLLEKVGEIVRLYTKEKEREMDPNDPYSRTIMDDLQIGLKTLFKHLILSVFKSENVSHLKTIEKSVQKQLDALMQEITDYRRTVSLFGGNATMCVAKDVEAFSEPVNAESDSGSEMDIEGQLDSDIEIVEESKTDATFSKESDLETSFTASGNCKAFNDVNIEKDNESESESESDSDITALLEWAKSNSTNKVDVCCIIEKLHYIQSENISLALKCLRYRLINQCCQISEEFLLWLLMSLFENGECIENGRCLRMIATTKPENWIFEWLIQEMMIRSDLDDELICRDVLSKVHGDNVYFFLCRYLSKLGEGELMTNHTIEIMVESLETLNPEVDESLLAVLEKTNIFEWSYQIKWNENINSLQSLPFSWQDESKLLDAAYYSSQIINRNGQKFVNEVYHCVKTYPVEQNIFLSALKRLYTGSLSINIEDLYLVESSEEASRIFGDNFIHHGIRTRDCILSIMKADSNTTLTEDQVRTIESILAQINKRSSKPSTVLTNTTEEDEDKNEYTTRNILSFTQNDIKVWSQVCKQKLKSRRLRFSEIFTEIAAVIERAITLKRGYGLRNTQKISIISFLFDLDASHKGILQQMSTGEGKTIVIVVLSILKVLQGEKVDIITSSSVLAKRDSEINKDIFDLFEISVSNNCSEDKHDRQDAYLSFVVYGEIGTFQRDILLTEFYDENIIGGRYRENVIVDEVDSMLLDRGETVLYLSHEIAGIDAIEFVYTYIWSLVNSKEMIGTDDDRKSVRQCMLDAMYGMISMTDISKCFPPENTINVHEIWNKLKKENIIDSEGRLLTRSYARFNQHGNNGTTNDGVTAGHVISMLKDTVRKGILVEIPKFLESFINRHLDTWIRNAFNAKYMEEGKHFIIDIDRTENDRGKDVNIVIMDIDTGTEQYHMQWNSGLHQFLQLKYKCAISSESLKAVFMSNISFFRLYNNLFGLTGTLGSQKERDLLKDMYNVSYITIPTFQEPKFVEHDTYLCDSTDKWVKLITETAVSLSKYRPVLVICETIHSCDEIEKEFKKNRVNAHVYKNSYCELSILKNETELESGCIILATNLAGRGTDIRISEDISVLGGLHVILTYLPSNLRIEEQAFGRAARKGQHGSGQLIICECMEGQHKTNEILTISRMKIQRDTSENERISKIQQRYETFIRAEERLFRKFQTFYDKLKQTLITKQTELEFQKVILQALLDRWAFWLDFVETFLEISGNFSSIKDSLGEFLQEIDVSWVNHDSSKMTMMLHSPSQLVKAGKAKTSSQEYNNAQTFFDKVIDCDPSFSESALYYKVHCLLKRGDFTGDDFKIVRNIFGICKYLIEQRIEKLRNAVQIVNVISSQYTNKREIFTVSDGYVQQKENAIQIYYQIIDSIDSMNGYAIEPTMFVDATCGHLNANMIFRDLDTMGILSPHKVRVFPPEKNTWQSVTESYELYSKEIYLKLNQIKDKIRVTADDFEDILPSREELWIFLIDQGVLKDTKDYILLSDRDFHRSRHIIPMQIIDILKSLECKSFDSDIDIKKHIFLYSDQKDKILAGAASLIRIDTFKDNLGFGQIFEVLKREKIVSTCSFALLAPESEEKMLHSRLPKFDHVGCNTFVVMGVPSNTSKVIFDQLVANEVLSIDGRLLTLELGSIWLSSFSNYTTEVRNIVAKYSKYRICTFHLLKELELPIDLFSRPHDILFGDLLEAGVVTPFKVKRNISEKEMTKHLKFLYGHECDTKKSELIEIVSSRIESGKYRNFTRSETKVLYDEGIYLDEGLILRQYFKRYFSELPKILSSEIYDLCRGECFTASEIERDLIDKMICVRSDSKDLKYLTVVIKNDSLKKTSLKQELRGVKNEIKCFISSRLQNYQNTSGFVAQLERWREGLAKFDNVDTELRSLADSCTEEQLIGLYDEILSMTNNGFGDLLVIKERKWTFKSVFKMFCILAIGLIQIGLALAIEFYSVGTGTFVANALLSEGVGDIMFAVECMISGHCTMQSYLHHKALSVAITVASAGIGAFAARGSKFSRFGNKIGGQFLQNQSGSALLKQGVTKRLLAKAAAKRIGKKLVEVASMNLVDKGVDFVIEKTLRASLVQFCGEITKSTPKVALKTIEILTESLSTLVRKVGKQNSEQIVEKFINKCLTLQQSDVSMILSKFGQIANAFGNGLGEAMEKLGHSGDSRMETLSKITKIVNVIGKGIKIVNAVQEVGTLRSSILEKFNNEIVAKLQFEDGDIEVKDCESWTSAQVDNVIKKSYTEVTKYLEMQLEDIVVKPLLQKVGYKITRQITKSISKLYRYGKTCLHQSDFNRLKAGHESELLQAPTEMKNEIKLQYAKKLLKLLKNTRDPNLFADIVKEGIPLGIHSVQAVSEITGAVINIETIGGDAITMPQKFTPCGTYCGEQRCITLQFHVNPETGIGHFTPPKSMDGESRHYDCLLEAVTQETGMPLQRDHIAETIKTHPEIRRRIKQGIHEHFIIKGGSGGVVHDRKKIPTSMEIIEQGRLLLISKQTKEDKILMELEKRGLPTTRQNKNEIWEEMKNENENGEIEISRQIKKSEYFFKSQRDKSKLSNNSEKATGNDELFETRLLVSEIAQSCVKNSPKYVEPTEIQFGDKSEDVDYLKAYYHCRFDTRYVLFIREGKLQGHAGALFSRSKDAVLESNEEGVKIKTSNVGGLTSGSKDFHKQRTDKVWEGKENHLFSILNGIQKHVEMLPTKKQLENMDLSNCYSPMGYHLDVDDHRDKFIIGLEREKYKLCIAAEHLIHSNRNAHKTQSFQQFERSFGDLKKTIHVDKPYKQTIHDKVKRVDSFKSFGNILKDPAPHPPPSTNN